MESSRLPSFTVNPVALVDRGNTKSHIKSLNLKFSDDGKSRGRANILRVSSLTNRYDISLYVKKTKCHIDNSGSTQVISDGFRLVFIDASGTFATVFNGIKTNTIFNDENKLTTTDGIKLQRNVCLSQEVKRVPLSAVSSNKDSSSQLYSTSSKRKQLLSPSAIANGTEGGNARRNDMHEGLGSWRRPEAKIRDVKKASNISHTVVSDLSEPSNNNKNEENNSISPWHTTLGSQQASTYSKMGNYADERTNRNDGISSSTPTSKDIMTQLFQAPVTAPVDMRTYGNKNKVFLAPKVASLKGDDEESSFHRQSPVRDPTSCSLTPATVLKLKESRRSSFPFPESRHLDHTTGLCSSSTVDRSYEHSTEHLAGAGRSQGIEAFMLSKAPEQKALRHSFGSFGAAKPYRPYHSDFNRPKSCGIRNLGNSCYFGAILQALLSLPVFKEKLLSLWQEGDASSADGADPVSSPKGQVLPFLERTKSISTPSESSNVPCFRLVIDLIRRMASKAGGAVDIALIKRAIDATEAQFRGTRQHDAHELLTCLISKMHTEMEAVVRKSNAISTTLSSALTSPGTMLVPALDAIEATVPVLPIPFCFNAVVECSSRCINCGYTSPARQETYYNFSLDFTDIDGSVTESTDAHLGDPHNEPPSPKRQKLGENRSNAKDINFVMLDDLLEDFFCERECDLACQHCHSLNAKAKVFNRVLEAPNVLILHLKRFHYCSSENTFKKLSTPVYFPLSLDLQPFMANHKDSDKAPLDPEWICAQCTLQNDQLHNVCLACDGPRLRPIPDVNNASVASSECLLYSLSAVVRHTGPSVQSGHYTCDVRVSATDSDGSQNDGSQGFAPTWERCDDSFISKVDQLTVLEKQRESAYIIFYTRNT